jgi:hypothetical protein
LNFLVLCIVYLANLFVFAIPLTFLECWLDKYRDGWGTEFRSPFWGHKLRWKWLRLFEKEFIVVYHVVVFFIALPLLFTGEYFLVAPFSHQFGPLYFIALWLGVSTLEDFLYFVFNWHFDDALERFWRGEMKWHTHYVRITANKVVPRFYITTPIWIAVLLIANYFLTGSTSG